MRRYYYVTPTSYLILIKTFSGMLDKKRSYIDNQIRKFDRGLEQLAKASKAVGELQVKVYDLNGRQVYNQNVTNFNNSNAINLGSLATGIYVLKLQGDNLNYSKKIILE